MGEKKISWTNLQLQPSTTTSGSYVGLQGCRNYFWILQISTPRTRINYLGFQQQLCGICILGLLRKERRMGSRRGELKFRDSKGRLQIGDLQEKRHFSPSHTKSMCLSFQKNSLISIKKKCTLQAIIKDRGYIAQF